MALFRIGTHLALLTALSAALAAFIVPERNIVHVPLGTSAAELNVRIAAAPAGTTFRLAPGTHTFRDTVRVRRGHVTLAGPTAGRGARIVFDTASGNGLEVRGERPVLRGRLHADAVAGARWVKLAAGHGFRPGDAIYMQQRNTRAWLDAHGWTNIAMEAADRRPFRESMHVVAAVDGSRVRLDTPLAYALEAGTASFHSVALLEGVRLEALTVTWALGRADPYDFSNPYPAFTRSHAVLVSGTRGAVVRDMAVHDTPSTAFTLHASIHANVENLTVARAHNKAGGGNGYGVQLSEAFHNRLTRLHITGMRHGFILSAWNAEVGNVVEIDRIDRDVNLHGSPDHSNTIRVREAVLDYGATGRNWMLLAPGARNHALTDFAANDITFARAVADRHGRKRRHDILRAADGGAFLYGGRGDDRLVGGRGADTIVGGPDRDVMTGGAGADTFVIHADPNGAADVRDRITDFEAGDRLVLPAAGPVTVRRTLAGMVVEAGGAAVLLEGVDRLDPDAVLRDADGRWSPEGLGV